MDKRKALFSGRTMAVVVVLAAVVLAAVGCWVAQQTYGLGITGMNNSNSWGLYIMAFMFFVGLSAGGLIVASSAHVFGIESFKRVSVPAVITSIVCICCAGAFVLIDLGGVARVWRMFVGLNFVSPLAWDMIVITCYLVINVLDLVWLVRGDERKVAVLSRVALPVAILVHSVTAWIFGLQIAKAWYSAIMAPIFVASACDSGLALLLICLLALDEVVQVRPRFDEVAGGAACGVRGGGCVLHRLRVFDHGLPGCGRGRGAGYHDHRQDGAVLLV